jgi:DNA invertase Pin-like site-specific DNA recombinase
MTVYAYLRVSTDQQDVDNQRYGLLAYANMYSLGPLQFIEDTISGRLTWRDRAVGRLLLETAHRGGIWCFLPRLAVWRAPRSRSWRCWSTV